LVWESPALYAPLLSEDLDARVVVVGADVVVVEPATVVDVDVDVRVAAPVAAGVGVDFATPTERVAAPISMTGSVVGLGAGGGTAVVVVATVVVGSARTGMVTGLFLPWP
jgi:hypothetical protein